MNYEDTWSWPDIPVDEIDREEIETIYSFGHYDGPGTGLIYYNSEHYYVNRFEIRDDRYWIIRLTSEQQQYALDYGATWAMYFHTGMSWQPNGDKMPQNDGIYAHRPTPHYLTMTDEGKKCFNELFPKRPEPDSEAKVVGYFTGWKI